MTKTETVQKAPPHVPRWLVRTIWIAHRPATGSPAVGSASDADRDSGGGCSGSGPSGAARARNASRSSASSRTARNLVTPAMNGWADPEPAWWLNLQANPRGHRRAARSATRAVTARAAVGEERARLWAAFLDLGSSAFTDASAALRSRETAIVVLEPRAGVAAPAPRPPAASGDPLDARDAVEALVERQDPPDVVGLHHREVKGVASGQRWRRGEESDVPARRRPTRSGRSTSTIPSIAANPASMSVGRPIARYRWRISWKTSASVHEGLVGRDRQARRPDAPRA